MPTIAVRDSPGLDYLEVTSRRVFALKGSTQMLYAGSWEDHEAIEELSTDLTYTILDEVGAHLGLPPSPPRVES